VLDVTGLTLMSGSVGVGTAPYREADKSRWGLPFSYLIITIMITITITITNTINITITITYHYYSSSSYY